MHGVLGKHPGIAYIDMIDQRFRQELPCDRIAQAQVDVVIARLDAEHGLGRVAEQ